LLEDSSVRKPLLLTLAAACGSLLLAGPASAASDYYLKIDTIKGEAAASSSAKAIEVSSFSWGMSQTSAAVRESPTKMSTGKTQQPVGAVSADQPIATSVSPATDSIKTFSLTVAESGNETAAYLARACASGQHIPRAVLTVRNQRYELKDVMVTSCAVSGNERRHELTGHVTLMK
jgi:type VI protein secretion system component Hcp